MSVLLEIVSPRGRRVSIDASRIVLVTENDDVTGAPGLVIEGVPMVQPVVGETYEGLSERVAQAKMTHTDALLVPSKSPVPVMNRDGMRVLPDGTPDRAAQGPRIVT
jgi:hypothetical protein